VAHGQCCHRRVSVAELPARSTRPDVQAALTVIDIACQGVTSAPDSAARRASKPSARRLRCSMRSEKTWRRRPGVRNAPGRPAVTALLRPASGPGRRRRVHVVHPADNGRLVPVSVVVPRLLAHMAVALSPASIRAVLSATAAGTARACDVPHGHPSHASPLAA